MKALNCTQCGALLKRISLPDNFAFCDYCSAKIIMQDDKNKMQDDRSKKTSFAPEFKMIEKEGFSETFVSMLGVESDNEELGEGTKKVLIVLMILFVFVMPYFLVKDFKAKTEMSKNQSATSATPDPYSSPIFPRPIIPSESLPNISYRTSVEYPTNVDVDSVELPVIDQGKFPTTDINELKKTIFAQRKIRVVLTINEDGNVISAKALNGHPILQESSIEAAKKSLFSARKRKTTAVFTYIYDFN